MSQRNGLRLEDFLKDLRLLSDRHGIIVELQGVVFPLRDIQTDRVVAHVFFDDYDGTYKERPATNGPR